MALVYFCSGGRAAEWHAGPPRSGRSLAVHPPSAPGHRNRCGVLDHFGRPPSCPGLVPARLGAPSQYGIHAPASRCRNSSLDSALDYRGHLRGDSLSGLSATAVHGSDEERSRWHSPFCRGIRRGPRVPGLPHGDSDRPVRSNVWDSGPFARQRSPWDDRPCVAGFLERSTCRSDEALASARFKNSRVPRKQWFIDFAALLTGCSLYPSLRPNSSSHFCRTACCSTSTLVNITPIPILGNRNTTLPSAVNVVFSCEILTRISVPSGEGFSMSRKHPPALRSLVLALSSVSEAISITSASAIMG